ncbi:MAG: hypothetical protein CMF80_06015 [Candidatus Marinimicrobia bacterium]|nr:hypothetical protein [Candidatus Neomarinimicrobiota bacterium]
MDNISRFTVGEILDYLSPEEVLLFTTTTKKNIEWGDLSPIKIPAAQVRKKCISKQSAKLFCISWFALLNTRLEGYTYIKEDIDALNDTSSDKMTYIFNTIDMYSAKLLSYNNMHSLLCYYGIRKKCRYKVKKFVFYNRIYKDTYIHHAYRIPKHKLHFFTYPIIDIGISDIGLTTEQCLNVRALIY